LRKSSAVLWLFLGLVGVPVAAAVHLGTGGLTRERAFLIGEERAALARAADAARDAVVRELIELSRVEHDRDYLHYLPRYVPVLPGRVEAVELLSPLAAEAKEGARLFADRFQVTPSGRLTTPEPAVTREMEAAARGAAARRLFADPLGGPPLPGSLPDRLPREVVFANRRLAEGTAEAPLGADTTGMIEVFRSGFLFEGDFALRVVRFEDGYRLVQGFRVDRDALARRVLAAIPSGDRIAGAELLPEEEAPRERIGPHGLPELARRWVTPPEGRHGLPLLLPRGPHLLVLRMRPSANLDRALEESASRVRFVFTAMGAVVVLGFAFAWRAVRAETALAARRSEFVSAVSHELRTPLTSIRMYADMLEQGWVADDRTAREYFALIAAESERLARLVNNVLDFSRIERGRKTFEMRRGDPAPVLRETAEMLRPYLSGKGFALEVAVPESLPQCSFDGDALAQIVVNLLDNAVKYGEGPGTREVRLEAEALDGEIAVRVLDRGPGVPDDEKERIFEPFQRGRNAAAAGGSGLGLALVRHYARAHGGRIAVLDREGGGAVFALALPRAETARP